MEINVYTDFLSVEEIQFLTGRKHKSMIIKQLNQMGIPFKQNANGYPIVRRDYDQTKTRKSQAQTATTDSWRSAVLA